MRVIGLMSGTSLDGIDAAVVELRPGGAGYDVALQRFKTVPFSGDFVERLLRALPPNQPELCELAALDGELGALSSQVARAVAGDELVDFIASHGLTAYHDGARQRTLQIGDPYRLRDALRATVVFDFRRADCAAGGHGAPLVPYVDALLFGSNECDVVALNLGGIANVTVLPRGSNLESVRAWDTGPGNMLLDIFVSTRTHGHERFDAGGRHAALGSVDAALLRALVERDADFFAQAPPKSTGRERFGLQCLAAHAERFADLSLEDGCATLCAFTANSIAASLAAYAPPHVRVVASGGGVHNAALCTMLRERLEQRGRELAMASDFGIDPDAKEALAFAILGYETLRGRPANVPSATGAMRPTLLGAIVPYELDRLLTKMRVELAANGSA